MALAAGGQAPADTHGPGHGICPQCCVLVLSPERIGNKCLMEGDRKRGRFVKDGEPGFYLDKTLNIHFKGGDLNGARRCRVRHADEENPRR